MSKETLYKTQLNELSKIEIMDAAKVSSGEFPCKDSIHSDDSETEQHTVITKTLISPTKSFNEPELNSNPLILVVEDNIIAQTVILSLLTRLSCQVDLASNGIEAIALYNQKQYDLIFMDIGLGEGMNGFEITRFIRSQSKPNHHIPIIALTAHAGESYRKQCIESGMDEVMTKPLTQSQAIKTITTFIPIKS